MKKFPGKPILGSLYLESDEGRWLTEKEFKGIIDYFVDKINEGKLAGIRVFRVENLIDRPNTSPGSRSRSPSSSDPKKGKQRTGGA